MKPKWVYILHNLFKQIRRLLKLLNVNVSQGRQARANGLQASRSNANFYANEIIKHIDHKCNGNAVLLDLVKKQLFIKWKDDILCYFNIGVQFTTMNTQVLQGLAKSPDANWRNLVSKIHDYLGWKLFNSERNRKTLRQILQPRTFKVFNWEMVKASVNQYSPRKDSSFWVSVIKETEIIGQCMDNLVNNNEWIFLTNKHGRRIDAQLGFDKATKGHYSETLCIAERLFSVKRSMASMYIPGL